MIRSFFRLLYVDPGLDSTNVLTITLPTAVKQFPDSVRLNSYLRDIQTAVEAVPGVRQTALSCGTPLQGTCYGMPMQPVNLPRVDVAKRDGGFYKIVTPSYFRTLHVQLVRGRLLSERDTKNAPRVLLINERLAKRWFPNEDPIGQQVLIQEIIPGQTQLGPDISWQIVGVVNNEKIGGMSDDRSVGVYVTNEQTPGYFMTLIVRADVDPLTLQKAIAAAVHSVNKDQALADVRTLNQIKDQSMGDSRLASVLLGIFGTLALLLSAIGIYGVISYSVAQRTQELGIRAALGASKSRLLGLVLKHGLILTAVGLIIGVAGALGLTRLMAALLYNLSARDPVTMVAAASVLVVVAAFACYVPARRATKVDPLVALRYE
jgi:putative ABC transport system permease protein